MKTLPAEIAEQCELNRHLTNKLKASIAREERLKAGGNGAGGTRRRVIVGGPKEGVYVDARNEAAVTKVHSLVYDSRVQGEKARRRDKEARDVLKGMKDDWGAFERRGPV